MTAENLPIVDGSTRLYGIIGHPITQVKSPQVFTARMRAAGMNALMLPMHVLPEKFDETVRGLKMLANLDGIVVTVPYKGQMMGHADRVLETGQQVGAINVLRREADGSWVGDMFDGRGMVHGLREHDYDPRGLRVMLIGAGGAGSAIGTALAEAGAAAVTVYDVDEGKARDLAARIAKFYPACTVAFGAPETKNYGMLVNATPIGMKPGEGLPAPLGDFNKDLIVADVIIKPDDTPLLKHAKSFGCRAIGGIAMLEGQAHEIARFLRIGV